MLRTLRSGGVVQVVMAGVVAAIIAVFVLEFRAAGGQQTGSLQRQCVVHVSGECLDAKDYYASFGLIVPPGVTAKQLKALGLRQHVLDGLVERELLVNQAENVGISVTPEAVDDELSAGRAHVSLPAGEALRLGYMLDLLQGGPTSPTGSLVRELPVNNPKTGSFDPEIYKRVVRNTARRSPKEFKNIQKRELIAARMRDVVRSRVRLSEEEALETFTRDRSKAVVRTVRLDRDWFTRYAVEVSDADADAYAKDHQKEVDDAFNAQKDQFKAGCPLVDEILVSVVAGTSDEDKASLKEKADLAKQALAKKLDFGTIAREVSDGTTAASGGDLGCLSKESYGEGAEALLDSVKSLEPGKVSGVIETTRGFHVLRYRGPLNEDPAAFGRRFVARRLAIEAKADSVSQEFAKALIGMARAGAKLEDATRELIEKYAGDYAKISEVEKKASEETPEEPVAMRDARRPKVDISAPFTAGENPLMGASPIVSPARIAFALEKAEDVHPEPIPMLDGYAVMQLKEKELAKREDFDKEKEQVMSGLRLAKQNDALAQYVAALRERHKDDVATNFALVQDGSGADTEE